MQRTKVKNQFSFDNTQVMSFLQEIQENPNMEKSFESIGKELIINSKPQDESFVEGLNFNNSTPKKLKMIKMPAKNKPEKMQKNKYDTYSLTENSKDLNSYYFDKIDSKNLFIERNILKEKISQSEKTYSGFYSNVIQQSFEEAKLRDEYLLYLGSQITPDLNVNTAFSKTSLKRIGSEAVKGKREIYATDKKTIDDEISPKKSYLKSSDCISNRQSLSKNEKLDIDLSKCEEKRKLKENLNLKYFNSACNIPYEESEEDYPYRQQNSKLIGGTNLSSDFSDHFGNIREIFNNFKESKEFLLKYLDGNKSFYIEGCDSNLNFFKISNADFCNHLYRIDFDMDNSYSKLAKSFSSEIVVNYFIPTHVLMSFSDHREEKNETDVNKVKANWIFSIATKVNEHNHKSITLDKIQMYL